MLQQDTLLFVSFFTNPIIISLTSLLIVCLGKEFFNSYKIGLILAILFSITSFIWPYNISLYLQPSQVFALTAAFYFIAIGKKYNFTKNSLLAEFFLGSSILIHPTSTILFPRFLLYALINLKTRKFSIFLSAFIRIISIQLTSNFIKFGSFSNFGYSKFQTLEMHSSIIGLVGLILSPGWGIIFYFPLILLLPIALYKSWKIKSHFAF